MKQLYTPPVEETVTQLRTTVAGFAGLELGKPDKVYVSLHASSQPGVLQLNKLRVTRVSLCSMNHGAFPMTQSQRVLCHAMSNASEESPLQRTAACGRRWRTAT